MDRKNKIARQLEKSDQEKTELFLEKETHNSSNLDNVRNRGIDMAVYSDF